MVTHRTIILPALPIRTTKMKLFRLFAVLFLFLFAQFTAFSHETQESSPIQQLVSTNATQVMVEILSGVKDEGGRIYTVTRDALGSAYEAVKAEAPEVVREFIIWKTSEALAWLFLWVGIGALCLYGSRRLGVASEEYKKETKSYYSRNNDGYLAFKWLTKIVGVLIILFAMQENLGTVAKATLAKRVFIIEYVAQTVHTAVNSNSK